MRRFRASSSRPSATRRGRSRTGRRTFYARTKDELRALEQPLRAATSAYVLQEWIPGPETSLLFHFAYFGADGRQLTGFTGRKLRQWPVGIGSTTAAEPFDDAEVELESRRVCEAAGLTGLGGVEFKRDPRDGALVIMEPLCGRAGGHFEISAANGVNVMHVAYCDLVGLEPRRTARPAKAVRFFALGPDVRAAAELHRRGELGWREFVRSYRRPRYVLPLFPSNPLPFLLLVVGFVRAALRSARGPRLHS